MKNNKKLDKLKDLFYYIIKINIKGDNMRYVYNKLVRDKIPLGINKTEGKSCNWKRLSDEEFLKELDKKLIEEAKEFIEAHNAEELADLIEVVLNIMEARGISKEEVEELRINKKNKKGGFKDKIYLIDVEE